MLTPWDYKEDESAVFHPLTRSLMQKVTFWHGGSEYDVKYPEGIPTSVVLTSADGTQVESGLVMFPAGHAGNLDADLKGILAHKFETLGALAWPDAGVRAEALARLGAVGSASADDVRALYATPYACVSGYE